MHLVGVCDLAGEASIGSSNSTVRWLAGFLYSPITPANRSIVACYSPPAIPALYSEMVSEDRRLRLASYEVYRFGAAELMRDCADKMVAEFFDQLAERMR